VWRAPPPLSGRGAGAAGTAVGAVVGVVGVVVGGGTGAA